MNASDTLDAAFLHGRLQKVLQSEPDNVYALCQIGKRLAEIGREQEARKCYRAAVEALRRAARAGDVQSALDFEFAIYKAFVKTVEEEQHYFRCFADWKDDLVMLGRRFRDPDTPSPMAPSRIAFFLQTGYILGHTQVLLKMLESRPRGGGLNLEPRVYILDDYEPAFIERCRAATAEVISVKDALGQYAPWDTRFLWLRERFKQDRVGVCVWVSVPTMATFALSMRLAPVQIFWALRFHPITGPYIDGYITWGAPGEKTRRYGKQDWAVAPMPLAIEDSPPESREVARVRGRFPGKVLLGTLAREEKIYSPPYLRAVAEILAANPQCVFLWTGRAEHPGIAGFFRSAGVAERCHFVGWVDTLAYASALDIFLETFPVGSGVTALQALGTGTPLLSYLHPETIFGTYFWPEVTGGGEPALDAPDRFPILCARDAAEYVALATRLVVEASWRERAGARGREFFLEEQRRAPVYAARFFELVERIASAKLGRPAR